LIQVLIGESKVGFFSVVGEVPGLGNSGAINSRPSKMEQRNSLAALHGMPVLAASINDYFLF